MRRTLYDNYQREPHDLPGVLIAIDLIGPLPALLTACNETVYAVDGFSSVTVASLALPSLTFTLLIRVPLIIASIM